MKPLPNIFKQALPVLQRLIDHGYEAYFVGGCVRDLLLKRSINDLDIATNAFPEEVKAIFQHTVDIGIEHGTVLVLWDHDSYEITTFRTESDYQDFRHPDSVTFVRNLSEDLKRRDFTMNALAMTITGDIIDLYQGIADLNQKKIKAVGLPQERFSEDALRMLRAVRFSSQLGFFIEEQTLSAIKKQCQYLSYISVERITVEWHKLLIGEYRNLGLRYLIDTAMYQYLPGLDHAKAALSAMTLLSEEPFPDEVIGWVLLGYYLDKTSDHITPLLKQWKLSNDLIKKIKQVLSLVFIYQEQGTWTVFDLYQASESLLRFASKTLDYLNLLSCSYDDHIKKVITTYQHLPIKKRTDLSIDGYFLQHYFNQKSGAWIGRALSFLEYHVLLNHVANEQDSLLNYLTHHQEEWL